MTVSYDFKDEFGPLKVIHVWHPDSGLEGVLVVDNVAAGPSIGGLRMAEDVSVEECFRLARAMTLKNAAAGLAHGGGKSVIRADPAMARERKEALIRAFARALRGETDYIFGPDMGTNEQCMGWVEDEIGRAVGLPRELGGIPLDELGATGWGLFHAILVALAQRDIDLAGARVVVQGYGAVGRHAARFLGEKGALLVAAGDSRAAIADPSGLDPDALARFKTEHGSLADFPGATPISHEELIGVSSDIWIPAARPDVLDEGNVDRLDTKIVAQGANIPATAGAERRMHERGILNLPDFIANAGGVICAAMEYHGASESAAFETIASKIRDNTGEMLATMARDDVMPREAALAMARARVVRAMDSRRWSTF